jgi:tellurite resistance protein
VPASRARRIPPNTFGVAFGVSGLAGVWQAAAPVIGTPSAVPDALFILAAAVWLVITVAYLTQGPRQLLADLRDPVLAPFLSLVPIVGMALGTALATVAFAAGRVLVVIFLVGTLAIGGWLFAQWVVEPLSHACFHPGYFLPTVAGGALGAVAAAAVGLQGVAEAFLGYGIISWLLLGSTVLNRLFFHGGLPAALIPTLAIEVAAPAVSGVSYLAVSRDATTAVAYGLGGYAALMVVMQLRFVPLYLRQRFSIATWSITFSYAIAAEFALVWIRLVKPANATAWSAALVALITILIGGIAVRTIVALARGQFLPATS